MDLRAASPTYDRVIGNFEQAAKLFVETGFFEVTDPEVRQDQTWSQRWREHEKNFPISKTFIRKVMRQVAKDLKRPIIIAEVDYWSGEKRIRVKLRKSKRTDPLVAQFMLLEEGFSVARTPISWRQDGSNRYFWFLGDKGVRAYDEWKRLCCSDPACRAALKLPPLEEPLRLAA